MKKLILITLLIFISKNIYSSEKCYIESYKKIIKSKEHISTSQLANNIIKKSNCNEEIINKFIAVVFSSQGKINSENLSRLINNKNISLKPDTIKLISASVFFNDKIKSSSEGVLWKDIKIANKEKMILLDNDDLINFECKTCKFLGQHNIKLNIYNPITSKNKIIWLTAKSKVVKRVLLSKKYQTITNLALNPNDFYEKEIETEFPEDYTYNKDRLKYYKINKTISKNQPLKMSHLYPINLVSPEKTVKVILRSGNLSIINNATSIDYGKIGDTINIKKASNGKIMSGKVVDYNKVVINL